MSVPTVTTALLETIATTRAAGREPVVVFDLDSTLYDDRLRTLRILHQFAYKHATMRPEFLAAARKIGVADMPYRVLDAVRQMGFDDPALLAEVLDDWRSRFFTSEYVPYDLPTPGAGQFMQVVIDAGALAVCLTGRAAKPMLAGTIATMQRDGLPVGSIGCRLILKPETTDTDEVFKGKVIDRLKGSATIVAAFDNEPGICNAIQLACPEALVFHMATTWTTDAPPLLPEVRVIADFAALLS